MSRRYFQAVTLPWIIILSLILSHCTFTHRVKTCDPKSIKKANKRIRGQTARIKVSSWQEYRGSKINIGSQVTTFHDPDAEGEMDIESKDIQEIVVNRRGLGTFVGLASGLITGGLLGIALGFAAGDDPESSFSIGMHRTAEHKATVYGSTFAAIGLALGLTLGSVFGFKIRFVFVFNNEGAGPAKSSDEFFNVP